MIRLRVDELKCKCCTPQTVQIVVGTAARRTAARCSARVNTRMQPWNGTSMCSGNGIPADHLLDRTAEARPVPVPGVGLEIS